MNSISDCFHAGVSFFSSCFGGPAQTPTTMDQQCLQDIPQLPELPEFEQVDTSLATPPSPLAQDHGQEESKHEEKHDTQDDLSELVDQAFASRIIYPPKPSSCSLVQDCTTRMHARTLGSVRSHLTSTSQDVSCEPVATRTRSKMVNMLRLDGPAPSPKVSARPSHDRTDQPNNVYPFQRRATQRWCRLLTATKSRLANNGLKQALGSHWPAFVQHAKTLYWPKWKKLLSSTMTCRGPLRGGPCPFQLSADPSCSQDLNLVAFLHLDHAYPLHSI